MALVNCARTDNRSPGLKINQVLLAPRRRIPLISPTRCDTEPPGDFRAIARRAQVFVTSLAHPGGNVTGISLYGSELARKRMEVLTEAVAGIRRIAVLRNTGNPLHRLIWEDVERTGPPRALQLRAVSVSDFKELPMIFSAMKRDGIDAFTHLSDAQFFQARPQISELAAAHRLPGVYEAREYVQDGGLISYGPNIPDLTRRSAGLVVKIIEGAKPADLPIEQPTISNWWSTSRLPRHSVLPSRALFSLAPTR